MTSDTDDERRIRALHDLAARVGRPDRRILLNAAVVELMDHLQCRGVPALLLKGPALSARLYRVDEHRACTDIDVLVARDSLGVAAAALAELGYENLSKREGIDDVAGVLSAQTWFRPYGVPVDLHWRLPGCREAWETLYAGRDTIELEGRTVATLGLTAMALHVATHAAQHGPGDLKAMSDLTRALRRWTPGEWSVAATLAAAMQATDAFAAGLRLVPEGAVIADELGLPAAQRLLWSIEHRDSRPRGMFHLEALSQARGIRERMSLLRRSLFPTRAWIAWEYRTQGSRKRMLAGYVRHLLRAPAWATRAWHYARRRRRALS